MKDQGRKEIACVDPQQLIAYLEGHLSKEARGDVEGHLLDCSTCRRLLATYIRVLYPETEVDDEVYLKQLDLDHIAGRAKALFATGASRRPVASPSRRAGTFITWRSAASIIALLVLSTLVWMWFARGPNLDEGMRALKRAYAKQRPLEARLTGGFPYAPYIVHRGQEPDELDQAALTLAQGTFMKALARKETPEAHHAMGRFYLLKHDYEAALRHFKSALQKDPDNAHLESDIGVAYLQKAQSESSPLAFERAIQHFSRALELEPTLLEALFDRALCYQKMGRFSEARADWMKYLEQDATSPWASEVRHYLRLIGDEHPASERGS